VNAGRKQAILKLAAMLNELADDVTVIAQLDTIGRDDFDMIDAPEQVSHRGRFRKELDLGCGVKVDAMCDEAPNVIAFPVRSRADLRVVGDAY
jgi:hypothetical protein